MKVKIAKTHADSIIPQYKSAGAACFDLHARFFDRSITDTVVVTPGNPQVFPTGVMVEIPEGHVMLVFSRSGHGFKDDTRLANCVGIIDADYRGEIMVKLTCDNGSLTIKHEDRVAQAMVVPIDRVEFEVVDALGETERGAGGFGSTGA